MECDKRAADLVYLLTRQIHLRSWRTLCIGRAESVIHDSERHSTGHNLYFIDSDNAAFLNYELFRVIKRRVKPNTHRRRDAPASAVCIGH